jgi:hypothetical protein
VPGITRYWAFTERFNLSLSLSILIKMNWLLKTFFQSQLKEIRESLLITLYQETYLDEDTICDDIYDAFYPFVTSEIDLS